MFFERSVEYSDGEEEGAEVAGFIAMNNNCREKCDFSSYAN